MAEQSYIQTLEDEETDFDNLFPYKTEVTQELPAGLFELGLVLGGTVSAGAYTAGVLDFLIEALDYWQDAKNAESTKNQEYEDRGQPELKTHRVPNWNVLIKAISGTSGGGVLAAMFAKALGWHFPHVHYAHGTAAVQGSLNPFYHVWVDSLDIKDLLQLGDIKDDEAIHSFLNSNCRYTAGNYTVAFPDSSARVTVKARMRPYAVNPLPIFLTLTNLNGLNYEVDWGNGLVQEYTNHADHIRLAVFHQHCATYRPRADELVVNNCQFQGCITWQKAASYALGTSAFPVGLPAELLTRPATHYKYRPVVVPGDKAGTTSVFKQTIKVNLAQIDATGQYRFLCVDGGVTNNKPVELCRVELAGILGRNERDGEKARRAVLLIDPFAEAMPVSPTGDLHADVFTVISKTLGSLVGQARYESQDLYLACQPDCFSRFMITAIRKPAPDHIITGKKAIASASLGAFGGFLSRDFREHDYFLGRRNCYEYLSNADGLWFPVNNPIFAAWLEKANPDLVDTYARHDSKGRVCLPLIPLFALTSASVQVPSYPAGKFRLNNPAFQELLEKRLEHLLEHASDDIKGTVARWYIKAGIKFGAKKGVLDKINEYIDQDLNAWDL